MPPIRLQTDPIVDVHTRIAFEELQNAVNSNTNRITGFSGQSRNQASPIRVQTVKVEGAVISIAGPDTAERSGDIRLLAGSGVAIARTLDDFTISASGAGILHSTLAGLTTGDAGHTQFLRSDADDTGTGSYTLPNAIPFLLSDSTPTINIGAGGSPTSLTFSLNSGAPLDAGSVVFDNAGGGGTGQFTVVITDNTMVMTSVNTFSMISSGTMSFTPGNGNDIILNNSGTDSDTQIKSANIPEVFKVDAAEDRVMVESRDILRYAYSIMASRG